MLFGIDKAAFYSSRYFLPLTTLATGRGVAADKYLMGLGQYKMAVSPPGEDVVTLAANAVKSVLDPQDIDQIDTVLFATESGIDQSKSAGIYLHRLLGLPRKCRVIELKQACYAATAGLQLALGLLKNRPNRKILLIASDVARYGLKTSGESSQGNGAVALLLSKNPRMLSLEEGASYVVEDNMDFWRPNYRDEALVDGRFSCQLYLRLLSETWKNYTEDTNRSFSDHQYFLYHTPFPRLAKKAHHKLMMQNNQKSPTPEELDKAIAPGLHYGQEIGNSYTASLFVSLLSLLENVSEDLSAQRIGFYSYGSGATAEYFSGVVQPDYQKVIRPKQHSCLIQNRQELNLEEYESFYNFSYPIDGSDLQVPTYDTGDYKLSRLENHKRIYEACL